MYAILLSNHKQDATSNTYNGKALFSQTYTSFSNNVMYCFVSSSALQCKTELFRFSDFCNAEDGSYYVVASIRPSVCPSVSFSCPLFNSDSQAQLSSCLQIFRCFKLFSHQKSFSQRMQGQSEIRKLNPPSYKHGR